MPEKSITEVDEEDLEDETNEVKGELSEEHEEQEEQEEQVEEHKEGSDEQEFKLPKVNLLFPDPEQKSIKDSMEQQIQLDSNSLFSEEAEKYFDDLMIEINIHNKVKQKQKQQKQQKKEDSSNEKQSIEKVKKKE